MLKQITPYKLIFKNTLFIYVLYKYITKETILFKPITYVNG